MRTIFIAITALLFGCGEATEKPSDPVELGIIEGCEGAYEQPSWFEQENYEPTQCAVEGRQMCITSPSEGKPIRYECTFESVFADDTCPGWHGLEIVESCG